MAKAEEIIALWNSPSSSREKTAVIPIDHVVPNPDQPRRSIDEQSEAFQELRNSIWVHGLLQPIVVSQTSTHTYMLLAGERRWRVFRQFAAHDADRFATIPAVVRPATESDRDRLVIGLTENLVREDLLPGDRAAAVERLRRLAKLSLDEITKQTGLSLSFVKNLSAVGKSEAAKAAVNSGRVNTAKAAAVVKATGGNEEAAVVLLGAVQEQPELPLGVIAKAMKRMPATRPAAERVKAAVAEATSDGEQVTLRSTPLSAVKPRVTTMPKADYEVLIRRAAREIRKATA